jgi:hypothetical protein
VFVDVAASAGLADTVETRAAAWGDFDADGDPDLYVGFANAPTAANRIYRNDRDRFVDVARELAVELRGVSRQAVWVDYDGDGDLDLFAAFRDAPNRLYRNDGSRFTDVSKSSRIDDPRKTVGAVWWDADADGDLDLFVANQEGDFDANGTLDLSLTNNDPKGGGHALLRNVVTPVARLLAVHVVDGGGRMTRAGAEVRVYRSGTRTLVSSGLVDTGSGYCSQNAMPVFVAAPRKGRIDVEVTTIARGARRVTRTAAVDRIAVKERRLVVRTGTAQEAR